MPKLMSYSIIAPYEYLKETEDYSDIKAFQKRVDAHMKVLGVFADFIQFSFELDGGLCATVKHVTQGPITGWPFTIEKELIEKMVGFHVATVGTGIIVRISRSDIGKANLMELYESIGLSLGTAGLSFKLDVLYLEVRTM
jgi:hypothetical protein